MTPSDLVQLRVSAAEVEPMHLKIFRVAQEWCDAHPGWKRICDIPNTDSLYNTWVEIPKKVRAQFEDRYHDSAEDAWKEFGPSFCKVPKGHVGTDGVFYAEITDVPTNTNSCMVFKLRAMGKGEGK